MGAIRLTAEGRIARFFSYIGPRNPNTGCRLWLAGKQHDGYGRFNSGVGRKTVKAHRFAWELANGPIPEGLQINHLCNNPSCVELSHLEVVPQIANVRYRDLQGRGATGNRIAPERRNPRRGDEHWSRRTPERVARGERSGLSKLSEDQIRAIRQRLASGQTGRYVAFVIGVSPATISLVKNGKRWQHVS